MSISPTAGLAVSVAFATACTGVVLAAFPSLYTVDRKAVDLARAEHACTERVAAMRKLNDVLVGGVKLRLGVFLEDCTAIMKAAKESHELDFLLEP